VKFQGRAQHVFRTDRTTYLPLGVSQTGWGCGDCRSLTFLFRSGVFLVDMWSEAFPKPALKVVPR
jgi:hypothetical protein